MPHKIIQTNKAPKPIGPYSQAILAGNTLYISGQIAIDPEDNALKIDNIKDETHLVLKNLHAVLNEAGFEIVDVVKCSIFIKDMQQFSEINAEYAEFFGSHAPARETVEVACLPKNVNVEISAIAVH